MPIQYGLYRASPDRQTTANPRSALSALALNAVIREVAFMGETWIAALYTETRRRISPALLLEETHGLTLDGGARPQLLPLTQARTV